MINIDNVPIHKILKSQRKTLKIEINNKQEITLRVPLSTKNQEIIDFVKKNKEWIKKTTEKINANPQCIKKYIENESFLFLGTNYPLKIITDTEYAFQFDGTNFIISDQAIPYASKYFELFYKTRAKVIIQTRVCDIAMKLGIKFNKLRITSATTRWGSCSQRGNVNFSWRLIMAEPTVIDYVIVHEFCHLFEFNHSKKFWDLVEKIMPDYKISKKWLEDNEKYMIL